MDTEPSPELALWWPNAWWRYQQLEHIRVDHSRSWRARDAASDEQRQICDFAVILWIPIGVAAWRKFGNRPSWRLPPDGWLFAQWAKEFPELKLTEWSNPPNTESGRSFGYRLLPWMDHYARQLQATHQRTQAPFLPVDMHRADDENSITKLRKQQRTNLPVFVRHAKAIVNHKTGHSSSGMAGVLADPDVDLEVPSGTVVYHQIGARTTGPPALAMHLALEVGDVVQYNHIRSATTKIWWFGSLHPTPRWLNSDGVETGLRLELAPRQGVYIDEQARNVVNIHVLKENELVLPAGTVWEVVGIADVVQSDSRISRFDSFERLRAIQMREIAPSEVSGRPVKLMTI
ncbi:hypothetical protein [Arthrobacter sp. efr-133-TYG-118]|uniref:hypothetical protein n=1 Tax=Arthrobacter sp. efr-133-TYG-118 TaxID=3040279 RepID=UPI00254AA49A|nr:hypothetical protein [Arthrobacter sp. efr-133-TYG-118]